MNISILFKLLIIQLFVSLVFYCNAEVTAVFVSPHGKDTNKGTKESPFLTITRAQQYYREDTKKGIRFIWLRRGRYHIDQSINFTQKDNPGKSSYLFVKGYPREKVSISGGITFKYSDVKKATNKVISTNISAVKLSKVRFVDLSSIPKNRLKKLVTDIAYCGAFAIHGKPLKALYFDLSATLDDKLQKLKVNEYFIDIEKQQLFFIPSVHFHGFMDVSLSIINEPLFCLKKSSFVSLSNLTFQNCLSSAIKLEDCKNCSVNSCTFTHVLGKPVELSDGEDQYLVFTDKNSHIENISLSTSISKNIITDSIVYTPEKKRE